MKKKIIDLSTINALSDDAHLLCPATSLRAKTEDQSEYLIQYRSLKYKKAPCKRVSRKT